MDTTCDRCARRSEAEGDRAADGFELCDRCVEELAEWHRPAGRKASRRPRPARRDGRAALVRTGPPAEGSTAVALGTP